MNRKALNHIAFSLPWPLAARAPAATIPAGVRRRHPGARIRRFADAPASPVTCTPRSAAAGAAGDIAYATRSRGARRLPAMPLGNSPPAGPVTVDFLKPVIGPDMVGVDQVLRDSLRSDVALIHTVADYIIGSGGKRLRPALLLLAARACGYGATDHRVLAAVVEMIHTATLLHDDVVDESDLRRGHATANAAFGNAASVLVGDFLYSRAFQLMVGVGSMRVLEIVADATNRIAEGEVMQLMNTGDAALDERAYVDVIERKTATLFEAAARIGAVLGGSERGREDALARYGRHLGIAFQIMDDVLDYSGDAGAI